MKISRIYSILVEYVGTQKEWEMNGMSSTLFCENYSLVFSHEFNDVVLSDFSTLLLEELGCRYLQIVLGPSLW